MIKKKDSKYILFSKSGDKKLGTFSTKQAALKREKEILFFKKEHSNDAYKKRR